MVSRSKSIKETQKVAGNLARKIAKSESDNHAVVVALEGELGAGKTTFVKGFARALGIKEKISSPTFVLLRKLQIPNPKSQKNSKFKIQNSKPITHNLKPKTRLYHIDAYRLRDHRDLIPLGIKEIFVDPGNIVLIEWAERVRKILPRKCIRVHIDHINKNTRRVEVTNPK